MGVSHAIHVFFHYITSRLTYSFNPSDISHFLNFLCCCLQGGNNKGTIKLIT